MRSVLSEFIIIGKGTFLTLTLLLCSIVVGFFLGVTLSFLNYCKRISGLVRAWISVIRGTPLILQLSFFYFTFPSLFHLRLTVLSAGILAFGLNSSAYIAEILRGGIDSLPKGQYEAAQALGIPTFYMWKDIILPQVLRNILPGLLNEIISLLKETAIIGVIGGMDIMRMAQLSGAQSFTYFLPLSIAGFYYYTLVLLITYAGKKIEKRWTYDRF